MSELNGTLVRVSKVDKLFRRGAEEIHVLGGLDLEVARGEFLALMGPSGSGKSTLLLTRLSRAERRQHASTALSLVGLKERSRHYPRQLSGGEQQRVGIARAIVSDPTLLLCDEPTGDLDRKSGDEVLDLLGALNRDHGKTIVMVTHDPHAAARAGRILFLDKGKLTTEPVE